MEFGLKVSKALLLQEIVMRKYYQYIYNIPPTYTILKMTGCRDISAVSNLARCAVSRTKLTNERMKSSMFI